MKGEGEGEREKEGDRVKGEAAREDVYKGQT